MTHAHTLTRHADIQQWVASRRGTPAFARNTTSYGQLRATLTLKFDPARKPRGMPNVDEGVAPVSWSAWLAELDRQHLALRVADGEEASFELVPRKDLN